MRKILSIIMCLIITLSVGYSNVFAVAKEWSITDTPFAMFEGCENVEQVMKKNGPPDTLKTLTRYGSYWIAYYYDIAGYLGECSFSMSYSDGGYGLFQTTPKQTIEMTWEIDNQSLSNIEMRKAGDVIRSYMLENFGNPKEDSTSTWRDKNYMDYQLSVSDSSISLSTSIEEYSDKPYDIPEMKSFKDTRYLIESSGRAVYVMDGPDTAKDWCVAWNKVMKRMGFDRVWSVN